MTFLLSINTISGTFKKIIGISSCFFYDSNFCSTKYLSTVKFMVSNKATKIDEIFTVDLTLCSKCQIDGEDLVNSCGLLRKHELYDRFRRKNRGPRRHFFKECTTLTTKNAHYLESSFLHTTNDWNFSH